MSENDYCVSRPITGTALTLTAFFDDKAVTHEHTKFIVNSIYLLIIVMFSVFLISLILARELHRQFERFYNSIVRTGELSLDTLRDTSIVYEFDRLHDAFDDMSVRIKQLMADSLTEAEIRHNLEIAKRQTEISLMQSQINPHFIYNTFEGINFMIKENQHEKAISMINTLSDMLRFVVKKDDILIPLSKELEYAHAYISIISIRHGDKLRFEFDVHEEYLGIKIVKFILQPLIENAVMHGLAPMEYVGEISITVRVIDSRLVIIVRDSGVGMDTEKLREVTEQLSTHMRHDRIGLANISNRIRMVFGDDYGIQISSMPSAGTTVTVTSPI